MPRSDPAEPIADIRAGARHLTLRFYVPSGLATTGMMMLVPTLPVYLTERTSSLTALSVVLAAAAIGGMAANLPVGYLVQRWGERTGFIGGIGLNAIGIAGLAAGGPVSLAFVACLVAGAGQSARLLARQAYARRAIGLTIRGRLMSLFGGIGRVAILTGPLLGGFIGEWLGLRAAFAAAAGLVTAAGVIAALAGPGIGPSMGRAAGPLPGRSAGPGSGDGADARAPEGYRAVWRTHRRRIGLVGLGMTGAAIIRVGRLTLIPLYGASIGLDLSDVGVVVAIAGGLDLVLFPMAGWLMDAYGRLYAAVPSFLIMATGLALLPLARSFTGLALAALVIGFGNGVGSGTMLTFSTDLAPADNPGRFLGLLRLLSDLGRILGPLAVGVVADQLDLGASSLVLAAVGLATAALFVFAVGEPTPTEPANGHLG